MAVTYTPRLIPKKHQAESIEALIKKSLANFDDQGLGKSKQAYDTGAHLIAQNQIDLMIFVVRASLRENIVREIGTDGTQLITRVVSGNKSQRYAIYNNLACHILIVSFETMISDSTALLRVMRANRTLLCIDESHYIKNHKSKRSQICIELSKTAKKTLVFSGTPAPNRKEDLFPQLKVLGFDVGEDIADFREKFGSLETLKEFLSSRMIRRKKEDLKELAIPNKYVSRILVKLGNAQRALYEDARDSLAVELETTGGRTQTIELSYLLVRLLRLVQISSNPRLLSPQCTVESSKILALDEIVNSEVVQGGRKLIVWTSFRANVDELAERYSHLGALKLYGGLTSSERKKLVTTFQKTEEGRVLIGVPACGREGFTLTRASTAVYLDRNFSYLDWAQSQDRIHRISQTEDCKVFILEAEETIDQHIDAVLNRKKSLQDFLLGDADQAGDHNTVSVSEALNLIMGRAR